MNFVLCFFSLLCIIVLAASVPVKTEEEENPLEQHAFDQILEVNKDISDSLFEGDIVRPMTRNAVADKSKIWNPLTVPYTIEEDKYSYQARNRILEALQEYDVRTCLTFVPHTDEVNYLNYILGNGCSAAVGMQGGGQTVTIGAGCDSNGIVIHETMHAVGFWHEQSRTDRDDYVQIQWDVIQDGKAFNFDKYDNETVDLLDEPYDYGSVMHYGPNSYSKNGSRTIVGLREGSEKMGYRGGFSQLDLVKVNKLYGCDVSTLTDSSGYTQWTEWSACDIDCVSRRKRFCDGDACTTWGSEDTQSSGCVGCTVGLDPDCGPQTLTNYTGVVTSPMYPYNYKDSSTCAQTIQAPEGFRIHLSFELMDIEHHEGGCYYDYLYIHDGPDASAEKLDTLCATDIPTPVISSGNVMTVIFKTDGSKVYGGFLANYRITNTPMHSCGFEDSDDYCGWTDDETGDVKFVWGDGPTPSSSTGPSTDHTLGTEYGHYLFLETSDPAARGNKARVISPIFRAHARGVCFSLWYSMFGINIGTLNIYTMTDGVLDSPPFLTFSDNRLTDDWYQARHTMTKQTDFQVVIEAERYDGWKGDIGIDDVMLEKGPCP